MLAPDIIIPFDDLNANIPSNWVRDTAFDDRIPVHSNTGTGTTGGSNTHTHTVQSHNHALNTHAHTVSFAYYEEASGGGAGANADPKRRHYHTSVSSSSMSAANSSSDGFTTGSGSTLPPYYEVIYIRSTGYNLIPPNGILFSQSSLSNLVLCNGGSGTPNLEGKFLKGASAGGNAGGTGGTTNHTHDITHSHTSGASHTHSGTSGGYAGDTSNHGGADSTDGVNAHTHTFTTGATVAPINSYSGSGGGDTLVYPPYHTLKPFKNMAGVNVPLQEGAIALTKLSTPPIGWLICDGNNGTPNLPSKYVMASATAGTTGGATTHTHANVSHTHTSSSHSHTGTTNNASPSTYQTGDGSYRGRSPHNHTLSTDSQTATYANSNAVFNTGSSIPAYIEVKYIMATASALGGGAGIILQEFM